MPDYPPEILAASARALQEHVHDGEADPWEDRARVVLDAALPLAAEAVAQKILAHMEAHGPKSVAEGGNGGRDSAARYRWRRHMGIAARIAARAFTTEAESKQQAAEALVHHVAEARSAARLAAIRDYASTLPDRQQPGYGLGRIRDDILYILDRREEEAGG